VFHTKNIAKHLENVPKDIHFFIIMMKAAYFVLKESHELKPGSENSKKRSGLSSLVQRVTAPLRRLIKRKAI